MTELPKDLAKSGALEIQKLLNSISGGKILDVATEGGNFILTLIEFLSEYTSFTGIDISKKKWKGKRFTPHPVEFLEMNAESLKFEDSVFDTVSISYSIHHLLSVEKVLAEIKRVLKPSGNFILQEMFSDGTQTEAQCADIAQHHWGAKIDKLMGIPHRKTYTKQEIINFVANVDLKNVNIIESTHKVNCLTCEDRFKCADPKNKSVIDFAIKEVEDDLNRLQKGLEQGILENNSVTNSLLVEGEKIKQKIRKYGSAPASHLFIVGRKRETS